VKDIWPPVVETPRGPVRPEISRRITPSESLAPIVADFRQQVPARRSEGKIADRGKYGWLLAIITFPPFAEIPTVLRVGVLLCDDCNEQIGFAFRSRASMAERLRCPATSVSRAITQLESSGAISVLRRHQIPPAALQLIERTRKLSNRSNVYKLNLEWASKVEERLGPNGGPR